MQIEKSFASRGIPVVIEGGSIDDELITFHLNGRFSHAITDIRDLLGDLAKAFRVPYIDIERDENGFALSFKRKTKNVNAFSNLIGKARSVPMLTAILGIDENGNQVHLRLEGTNINNVLVAGNSPDERILLLRTMALSIALTSPQSRAQLIVVDSDSIASDSTSATLAPLEYCPHMIAPVIKNTDDLEQFLSFIESEMTYRQDANICEPSIIILVPELDLFVDELEVHFANRLMKLFQFGNRAGIRFIFSIDDGRDSKIEPLLRHAVDLRFLGHFQESANWSFLAGNAGMENGNMKNSGWFEAMSNHGNIAFQPAEMDDYELHYFINRLYRSRQPVLVANSIEDSVNENADKLNQEPNDIEFTVDDGEIKTVANDGDSLVG